MRDLNVGKSKTGASKNTHDPFNIRTEGRKRYEGESLKLEFFL